MYLIVPLPIFNYQGRLYALNLILKSLVSPITGVVFPIIWMTDQWISLSTPSRDLAYTVCYYQSLDFSDLTNNPCKNSSRFEVVALAVVIALSYRILQCIRLGISEGKYFGTKHMVNSLKYVASLTSTITSFLYNNGSTDYLYIWIASSIISTLFSYCWDLKMDWDLLTPDSRNPFLRKYLTFSPRGIYYFIMIINLIMRCAWTFTLSPSIAQLFGNSNLFTLLTGSVEIIRRGIWNLLRV